MICANCRRPLKNVAAEVGRMKFGRICAQRLGLIPSPEPRGLFAGMNPPAKRDLLTQDLFNPEDPKEPPCNSTISSPPSSSTTFPAPAS